MLVHSSAGRFRVSKLDLVKKLCLMYEVRLSEGSLLHMESR
jgi:hypothetical protein